MSQSAQPPQKYRAAIGVLNRARESMLDSLADTILEMDGEFRQGGFQVNEFLEVHGSRLHFLCLMISQFEMAVEMNAMAEKSEKPRPQSQTSNRPDEPTGRSGEDAPASKREDASNEG